MQVDGKNNVKRNYMPMLYMSRWMHPLCMKILMHYEHDCPEMNLPNNSPCAIDIAHGQESISDHRRALCFSSIRHPSRVSRHLFRTLSPS
jgi:hypothetical protein